MKIALIAPDGYEGFFEYFRPFVTPSRAYEWKGVRFELNPSGGVFDGAVVHQSTRDLGRVHHIICPPGRTLLALKEPPDICFLPGGYLAQFGGVLCHDTRVPRRRRLLGPGGHHWFVEVPFDEIEPTRFTAKPKLLSAVVSAKTTTVGHRKRLAFMRALKAHFGDELDWWGRGIKDLTEPKITALAEYRYHIAIENGAWPGYWTEKLIDCYVANCVPIYWGAPDVGAWFDPETIVPIDLGDPAGAIARIEAAIESDLFTRLQPALAAQRRRILDEYHPYEIYLRALDALPATEPRPISIAPRAAFPFTLGDRVKNRVWRLLNRRNL